MKTLTPLKRTRKLSGLLIALFACFALSQRALAVTPAPDGGYPGGNTAEGQLALGSLTTGIYNNAVGIYSLLSLTTGSFNTADGAGALLSNTADENTATGAGALLSNTTGSFNTANGAFALFNSTAGFNTAIGDRTLFSNTTGDSNVAVGIGGPGGPALFSNTTGRFNTAVGGGALFSNTEGGDNTAIGAGALADNVDGGENTAVGLLALLNNTGSNNVALGSNAGSQATTGSNNVYIGFNMQGSAGESNACYIKSIFGETAAGGSAVFIDANSKLGTITSSKRFKKEIKPMDKASEALFALKPVAFRYKKEIDPAGKSQFGLVAEEVEEVNPDLVVRDKEGKPYSVRYDQVNAMLLNEFLKEHRKVQEQQAIIAQVKSNAAKQETTIACQQKQIEALTAGLQKVNARLEVSRPAPQVAKNNH